MCAFCRTRMRGGYAVHASTAQHRRAVRKAEPPTGDRIARGRPAWADTLARWDQQYDL